jgi:hypothetical protein
MGVMGLQVKSELSRAGAWGRGGLCGPITPVKTAQIAPEALSWHRSVVHENGASCPLLKLRRMT